MSDNALRQIKDFLTTLSIDDSLAFATQLTLGQRNLQVSASQIKSYVLTGLTTDSVEEGELTTRQYFSQARARATVLTGLDTSILAPVTATDTMLQAFGHLQAQFDNLPTIVSSITAGAGISVNTITGDVTITNSGVRSITGTANQITVTGTNTPTLSLPQDIAAASSPTFAGLGLTGGLTLTADAVTGNQVLVRRASNNNQQLYFGVDDSGNATFVAIEQLIGYKPCNMLVNPLRASSYTSGSGTANWISISAGGALGGNRGVMGCINNVFTYAAHNSTESAWADVYLNYGGNTFAPNLFAAATISEYTIGAGINLGSAIKLANIAQGTIASPASGMMIFDGGFKGYNGSAWETFGSGTGDVTGAASSLDTAISIANGTSGKSIKFNSTFFIDEASASKLFKTIASGTGTVSVYHTFGSGTYNVYDGSGTFANSAFFTGFEQISGNADNDRVSIGQLGIGSYFRVMRRNQVSVGAIDYESRNSNHDVRFLVNQKAMIKGTTSNPPSLYFYSSDATSGNRNLRIDVTDGQLNLYAQNDGWTSQAQIGYFNWSGTTIQDVVFNISAAFDFELTNTDSAKKTTTTLWTTTSDKRFKNIHRSISREESIDILLSAKQIIEFSHTEEFCKAKTHNVKDTHIGISAQDFQDCKSGIVKVGKKRKGLEHIEDPLEVNFHNMLMHMFNAMPAILSDIKSIKSHLNIH